MRTIVIGDVHGCYRELTKLLSKVSFDKDKDMLIYLGDLMDRGKCSYEVFTLVCSLRQDMKERCIIIRGNHEQMLMDAAANFMNRELWKQNGGTKTISSFIKNGSRAYTCANWLKENTVLYYQSEHFQCCHAGLDCDDITNSSTETLLWDRTRFSENDYNGKLTIVGHTPITDAVWLYGDGKTGGILPEHEWLSLPENGMVCIDTGCVFKGRLTAMVIDGISFYLDSVFWGTDES